MTNVFFKDPDARLDYGARWSDWLAVGETISVSSWVVPAGITQYGVASLDADTQTAFIWLEGGTEGSDYRVVNRITTSDGRKNDQTITLKIRSR